MVQRLLSIKISNTNITQDPKGLADLILKLDETELKRIGGHAREVYFKKYSKENFINTLLNNFISNQKN